VARGRSVPAPPRHSTLHPLAPPLNPYLTSPDTRLLVDLLASLHGPGAALRVLALLEADVGHSWRVSGLTAELTAPQALTVYWKDPPVLGLCSITVQYSLSIQQVELACTHHSTEFAPLSTPSSVFNI